MKHDTNYYKNPQKNFTKEMVNDTLKYQKQYGFKIGKNNLAVDNEADAFRHTYMQAYLSLGYGKELAKYLGDLHESSWKQANGKYSKSSNMDLWNNRQGREIAIEIHKEYPHFKSLSENRQKDIIAQKVVQRMKKDKLITGLEDSRKYKDNLDYTPMRGVGGVQSNGVPLGFAAPIDTPQSNQQSELFGYTNPLTGNNRIFTREDVSAMSPEEFQKSQNEIDAQIKAFNGTMPTNGDLQREAITGGGVIYVNSYTRSDGTNVKGYYRSK